MFCLLWWRIPHTLWSQVSSIYKERLKFLIGILTLPNKVKISKWRMVLSFHWAFVSWLLAPSLLILSWFMFSSVPIWFWFSFFIFLFGPWGSLCIFFMSFDLLIFIKTKEKLLFVCFYCRFWLFNESISKSECETVSFF